MSTSLLRTEGLVVGYGGRPVLDGFSFALRPDEVLCLIGHNGAGKSTLLKALFGLIPYQGGQVFRDDVHLGVIDPKMQSASGISLVPEGRGVFKGLTVSEIFKLSMWSAGIPKAARPDRLEWVFSILPALKIFYQQRAGTLSGGQQQIVSIGRALLIKPRCMLLDEPSIGLAPKLFQDLLYPLRDLQKETGMAILLVEQNVKEALKIADRVIVLKSGVLVKEAFPDELSDNAKLMELY